MPHERARPLGKGSVYPAKDPCSQGGLCEYRRVAYVEDRLALPHPLTGAIEPGTPR